MPNINVLNEIQIKQDNNTTTSYKVGTVNGYYNPTNGKFYKEYPYVNEIEGASNLVYVDLGGNKLYVYKNSSFVNVSGSGGGSADNIVFGYYKEADGKFYEDSSYTTEIVPNLKNLYINLTDETIFRYDATNSEYVEINEAIDYSSEINSLSTENSTQTSEINSLSQSASELASTASTHTSQISSLSTASSELASEYTVINSEVSKFNSNLTANNIPFKFGYDSTTQKYGYIINEGGADTVIPFKTIQTSKTVTADTSTSTVTPDSGYDGIGSITVNPTPSQTKSASPSTSVQTISPDNGKLLSSVSISAISPQNTNGSDAVASGIENDKPWVSFPYGWWPKNNNDRSNVYMTAAQAVAACPSQSKSVNWSTSAQTVSPDSGKLLSSVSVGATPDARNSYVVGTLTSADGRRVHSIGRGGDPWRVTNSDGVTRTCFQLPASGYYEGTQGEGGDILGVPDDKIRQLGWRMENVNSGTYYLSKVGTADMGSTNSFRYITTSSQCIYLCSLTARVFEPTSSSHNKQLSFYKSYIYLDGSSASYPLDVYSSSYLTGTTATYSVSTNVQFRFTFTYSVSNLLGTLYVTKIEVYNNSGSSIQAFANMYSSSLSRYGRIRVGAKISSNATWTTISNSTQGWASSQDGSYSSASAAYAAIGTGSLLFGYINAY